MSSSEHIGSQNLDEEQAKQRVDQVVEPNQMTYVDSKGVERRIFLPKGSSRRAGQLLMESNWDELAKFQVWSRYLNPEHVAYADKVPQLAPPSSNTIERLLQVQEHSDREGG